MSSIFDEDSGRRPGLLGLALEPVRPPASSTKALPAESPGLLLDKNIDIGGGNVFLIDPRLRGYKLGAKTSQGYRVIDGSGREVGFYSP